MLTQRRGRPAAGILCCALLAAACTTRSPGPVALPPKPIPEISHGQPQITVPTAVPAGARAFDIDAGQSVVTILVHRAGPLAKFGHNHVVTSNEVGGVAWVGRELAGSGFEIRIPVASLVVDDPTARAAAGGDFSGEIPQSAREGTYRNMTRPEVLDVARFPEVVVHCAGFAGSWERPVAVADLTIRGVTRRVEIPVELTRPDGSISARGSLRIFQTHFGITPFSIGGGAIQVGDELDLAFEVVALAR